MSELGTIGTATGTLGLVVGVSLIAYKFIKHSKCRSRCCNCFSEVNIELESPKTCQPLEAIQIPDAKPASVRNTPTTSPSLKGQKANEAVEELKI